MAKLIRMLNAGAGHQKPKGKEEHFERGLVYEVADGLAEKFVKLGGAVDLNDDEIKNLKPEEIAQPK